TGTGCGASRLEFDHRVGKWNDLYLSTLDAHACSRDSPSRPVDPLCPASEKAVPPRLESLGSIAAPLKDKKWFLWLENHSWITPLHGNSAFGRQGSVSEVVKRCQDMAY